MIQYVCYFQRFIRLFVFDEKLRVSAKPNLGAQEKL